MIRFANLKIKTKMVVVLLTALLPLIAGELLTIWYFGETLKEATELELTNVVKHLDKSIKTLSNRQDKANPQKQDATQPSAENVKLLESIFLSYTVGKSGYPYVMDTKGNLIIHPAKSGQNIYDSRDSEGFAFIKDICKKAVTLGPGEIATIRYPWANPEEGETTPRMKIVKFMYQPDWDWIVAVGAYEEEIYEALPPMESYTMVFIAISIVLVLILSLAMNRFITRPIIIISKAASRLAAGDLGQDVSVESERDELAILCNSFNTMAEQIEQEKETLERLVDDRTRALRESREKYRSLVENTVDGIVTSDRTGTITFANSGMEKMMGMDRKRIIGRKIWEYYTGGIAQARSIMKRLRAEGNIINYEQELIVSNGTIPISTTASLLIDEDGNEIGTLGIFSDISVRKQLEADLKKAQVDLVQTMKLRALGDLVAGVAHEINNPLMASTTMLYVIEKNIDDCDMKMAERVDLLKRCNDRITKIVNHLREFSRQSAMEKISIDINKPLGNALLISSQQLLNLQIIIEKDFASDLPPINGDSNYLEQVFLDLIANARDALASNEGVKILKVGSKLAEMDGLPAVAAYVKDNGPGIPEKIQEKIFEPFFTTKGAGVGTGLGLSIVYGIVDEHGGRIDLESSPETGSTFTILIPQAAGNAA